MEDVHWIPYDEEGWRRGADAMEDSRVLNMSFDMICKVEPFTKLRSRLLSMRGIRFGLARSGRIQGWMSRV